MYEKFTDRARRVMQLAQQEAQRFNHEYVGTEHLLLGMVKEGRGVAANVLKNLDIDLRKIRLEVEKIVQSGPDMATEGKLPQTPRVKKVIEYSIEYARKLNHNYVGTEHMLLGLLKEEGGISAQVLVNLGLSADMIEEEILNLLGHSKVNDARVEETTRIKVKPEIIDLLDQKDEAVVNQDFERAAKIRENIKRLESNDKRNEALKAIAVKILEHFEKGHDPGKTLSEIRLICRTV